MNSLATATVMSATGSEMDAEWMDARLRGGVVAQEGLWPGRMTLRQLDNTVPLESRPETAEL